MQLYPHQPRHPSSNLESGLPLLIGTSTGGRSAEGGVLSLAVADGVGGGARGDLASQAVVSHWVGAHVPDQSEDVQAFAHNTLTATERFLEHALVRAGEAGAGHSGSMLVGAWLFPSGDVLLAHVGDCRAYLFRLGELLLLTRDHTYGNLGLTPPPWRRSEHPARMVGGGMMGPPDVRRMCLQPGDLLLLCSDGLHAPLAYEALANALRNAWQALPMSGQAVRTPLLSAMCRYLAQMSVDAGGQDDISVALAWYADAGAGAGSDSETAVCGEAQGLTDANSSQSVWPSDVFGGASS